MTNLSIIIVNYNAGDYLISCLDSLKKFADGLNLKIYIVDNASSDESISNTQKKFPEFNYILNKENLGFGKANNQALKFVNDEFVLFLNPDTEIQKDVLQQTLSYLENNPDVGAVTAKLILEDGSIDWACHRGFPTPLASLLTFLGNRGLYNLTNKDLTKIHEVDAISGAFFLTRKNVLEKTGDFDEKYFMYAEDIDLCFRIKQIGLKIVFIPTVTVIHHKGISSGLKKHSQQNTSANLETKQRSLDAFYKTMIIFYKKNYQKKYPFFINWLIYFSINLRWWLAKQKLTV